VTTADLDGFGDVEVAHVEGNPSSWLLTRVEAGDLVLAATGRGSALVDSAQSRLTRTPDVGLAVMAGPGQAGSGFAPGVPSPFVED
jgi:hypothetical protein